MALDLDEVRFRRDPDYRARQIERAEIKEALTAIEARRDVNVLGEYVFGFKQHDFHKQLQQNCDENPRNTQDAPIEHGKTMQVSMLRNVRRIGQDSLQTGAILSNSAEIPEMVLEMIATHIENNTRLHRVYPDLRIAKFKRSKTGNLYLTVERPASLAKDPTIVALSINGTIQGRRWTFLSSDDIQDLDNTWTEHERRKTSTRWESQVENRLVADATHDDVGTPWHVSDTRHQIRKKPGYAYFRFDATTGAMYDKNGRVLRVFGETLWPTVWRDPVSGRPYGWPLDRLQWKRENTPELEFARQFRCIALSGMLQIFKQEDLEYSKVLGQRMGLVRMPALVGEDQPVATGVDLAVEKKDTADLTVLHSGTAAEGPRGRSIKTLDIRAGRWEITEILQQMLAVRRLYPRHVGFRVENVAAQAYLLQVAANHDMMRAIGWTEEDLTGFRVFPHKTTAGYKYDPIVGIRGMAVEFEQKRWAVPCGDGMIPSREVADFLEGLLAFDPVGHTSDHAIAAWLFWEQLRTVGIGGGTWERFGIG